MQHADAFAIFAKVGDLESVSGAARALGLPKAKVSRAVTRLEAAYQVPLIDRTSRRVRLTEVGWTLHAHCLRVLDELETVESKIAAHRGLPAGTLRIGCSGDVARVVLAPNLSEFLDRFPEIDLRVRVGERLLPEPNKLDLVLHAGWLRDSRLLVRKVIEFENVLAASSRYVEVHGLPETVDDLAVHPIIGNFYHEPAASEIGRLAAHVPFLELIRSGERHAVPIWKRFASTDHSLMVTLVEQGKAIAPLAIFQIAAKLKSGELVRVLPDYQVASQPALYALYTERIAIAPKLRVFLEFVSEKAMQLLAEVDR